MKPEEPQKGSLGDAAHGGSGSWQKDENGWRYNYADGTMEAGYMVSGTNQEQVAWQMIDGKWWTFGADGYLKVGWIFDQNSNEWYWVDENNGMEDGWQFVNGKWYYFNNVQNGSNNRPYGSMYKNEKTPDGYFVNPDGSWDGNTSV